MKPQILPGISRADYDKIDALNISLLIEGEKSMAHLDYVRKHPKESTPAMEKGTAVHLAVFEPEIFEQSVESYEGIRRGKEWEKFKADNPGSLILKTNDFDAVADIRDALRAHPRVKELLDAKGTGEMGAVWTDAETGILCKGLLDRFCQCWGYSIVLDLKTTTDARPVEFATTVYKLNYHTKAAWYLDGLAAISDVPRRFLWIAVESEGYHGISIYDPSDNMLQKGRQNYRALLTRYADCLKTGVWPGYPIGEDSLELPKWSL